jgi:hydroxyacyl-ACP dehydratase HTD2-like protein with hotdog domain
MKKFNFYREIQMIETEERLETIQLIEEAKAICGDIRGELNPGEVTHEEASDPV